MGLRPSVKGDDNKSDNASNKGNRSIPSRMDGSSPSHHEGQPSSASSPPSSPQPQREAWTARGQLLLNFHHAISRAINNPEMAKKCNQIAEAMSPTAQPPSGALPVVEEYSAEAALIVENKTKRDALARNKAMASGLFAFVMLRSGRGLSSWIRNSIATRRSSYQFEKLPGMSTKHTRSELTSRKINIMESTTITELKQPTKLRKILRLVFDATISTSITLLSGAFLFRPKPSAYIEDMSKLPLVEGKSVYAEMVCPPLLQEYQRVLEQYGGRWPVRGTTGTAASASDKKDESSGGVTQEDVSLNIIRSFVENCSKRSKYERALLEERNALNFDSESTTVSRLMERMTRANTNTTNGSEVSSNTGDQLLLSKVEANNKLGTVSIPSPGVPDNVSVNLDQDLLSLITDNHVEESQDGENSQI